MSHNAPGKFSTTPLYVGELLFITYTVPPVHVTTPALVSAFCTYFVPLVLRVKTPLVAMVRPLPLNVPLLQLNRPL